MVVKFYPFSVDQFSVGTQYISDRIVSTEPIKSRDAKYDNTECNVNGA